MKYLIGILLIVIQFAHAEKLCEQPSNNQKMQKSFPGLVAGEDGWLFRNHDLLTRFGPKKIGLDGLARLQIQLQARGTTLVMVPVPTRALVHAEYLGDISYDVEAGAAAYGEYLLRLRNQGIVVPRLETLVDSKSTKTNEPLFFARDHHWTSKGAQQVARLVAHEILNRELVTGFTTKFTTNVAETGLNPGSYNKAAQALCGFDFEGESFQKYQTEAELDLFADTSEPDIVLVGTSNSNGAIDYNFGGFLQEFLGVAVANLAQSGGGYDGAILEYVASEAFRQTPPAVLIWEVPGYYSLNTASFYQTLAKHMGESK